MQTNLHSYINRFSFLDPAWLRSDSAWTLHLPFAFWLVAQLKPKTIVELGVHSGTSYFGFCEAVKQAKLNTQCYGVDTWLGDEHAGFYPEHVWLDVNGFNAHHYEAFSQLIRTSFDEALPYFNDGFIELLHIDGLHTYEAVRHDFEAWLPKMSAGGIMLFHDTMVRGNDFGVYKLWAELSQQYPSFQFIHGHGLGVLLLDKNNEGPLTGLTKNQNTEVLQEVQHVYYQLGSRWVREVQKRQLEYNLNQHRGSLEGEQEYQQLKAELEKVIWLNEQLMNQKKEVEATLATVQNDFKQQAVEAQQHKEQYEELQALHTKVKELAVKQKAALTASQAEEQKAKEVIASLRHDLQSSMETAEELRQNLMSEQQAYKTRLNREQNNIEKLQADVAHLVKQLQWYQNTFENRSLAGIIKQKMTQPGKK